MECSQPGLQGDKPASALWVPHAPFLSQVSFSCLHVRSQYTCAHSPARSPLSPCPRLCLPRSPLPPCPCLCLPHLRVELHLYIVLLGVSNHREQLWDHKPCQGLFVSWATYACVRERKGLRTVDCGRSSLFYVLPTDCGLVDALVGHHWSIN